YQKSWCRTYSSTMAAARTRPFIVSSGATALFRNLWTNRCVLSHRLSANCNGGTQPLKFSATAEHGNRDFMTEETTQTKTEVGNYFVSNYPPFSQWKPEYTSEAVASLNEPPRTDEPLGLYLHIPFCRKRCTFCYFKVYTDKNASQVETYLDALIKENELYSCAPALQGRQLRFAYFGGGTPSYISDRQLHYLVEGLNQHVSWENAEEVTFECEPGTLKKSKLETLKEIGVTRLSLGIEHFDDRILAGNGRAHLSAEIYRAYEWAREVDFPQINIDLIAGMVGDNDESWRDAVRRAIEMEPDSVTIYQMELPYNTVISQEMLSKGIDSPVADWPTKRR